MITLRNKIAQMLVMGFDGCTVHDKSPVVQWLSNEGLGGVLLFDKDLATDSYGKNLKNQSQIKELIRQLNHYNAPMEFGDEKLPLLTAIDYEGGNVDRLSKIPGCMTTSTALELARLSEAALEDEVTQMAFTLKSLGFNLNFAPVVDLNINNQQGIIGNLQRSFSLDPQEVSRIAAQFAAVFSRYGIACAYKHFPGHGSAIGDTHEGFVDVSETFQEEELVPYKTLLQDTSQPIMVMTAHVVNKRLDDSGLPATLSHKILTNLLRETFGFDGLIISDDLQMRAISEHYSLNEALALTINAGADMMIFGNQLGNHTAPQVIDSIEQLVLNQKIDPQRIDDAYRRIVRLKKQINYWNSQCTI